MSSPAQSGKKYSVVHYRFHAFKHPGKVNWTMYMAEYWHETEEDAAKAYADAATRLGKPGRGLGVV